METIIDVIIETTICLAEWDNETSPPGASREFSLLEQTSDREKRMPIINREQSRIS